MPLAYPSMLNQEISYSVFLAECFEIRPSYKSGTGSLSIRNSEQILRVVEGGRGGTE